MTGISHHGNNFFKRDQMMAVRDDLSLPESQGVQAGSISELPLFSSRQAAGSSELKPVRSWVSVQE